MKKTILTWVIRIIIFGLIGFFGYKWGKPVYSQYFVPKKTEAFVPTTMVKKGPFVVSFIERGDLRATKSSDVRSEINGKIISIVSEGQSVVKGDTIVTLDPTQLRLELADQELAYENSLSDIQRAENELVILKESNKTEIAQAQADLDFNISELKRAEVDLVKKQSLADDKLIPTSELDSARLQVQSKKLSVDKGTMSLELKRKSVQVNESQKMRDISFTNFRSNRTKRRLEEAKLDVNNTKLFAPAPGLVVLGETYGSEGKRKLLSGDNINPQQLICTIPDLSNMEAKVKVGEGDVSRLKIGMPVLMSIEAIPGRKFKGIVKDISTLASTGSPWDGGSSPGKKTFEVSVTVLNSDPKVLRPGMTVQAEFVSNSVTNAVYIPIEAVLERSGNTWVYVKERNAFRRQKVVIGMENDNNVIIKSGLQPGQIIALRDPSKVEKPDDKKDSQKEKTPAPIPTPGKG